MDDAAHGRGYPLLLGLLMGMFVIQPWASQTSAGPVAVGLLYAAILLGSLFTISRSRKMIVIGVVLAVPAIALGNLPGAGETGRDIWGNAFACALLLMVIGVVLRDVFAHRVITLHSVSGAVCVFLLLGVVWTVVYQSLDQRLPNAFEGLVDGSQQARGAQLFYFSFVTLTTLGYGDVTPARPETMSLATLEAIVGQLYLVVLVAYLVARLVTTRANNNGQLG